MSRPLDAAAYACLFSGHPRVVALRVLHSWAESIDALVASGRTRAHEAAHHKLQWWQEELQRLNAGTPVHPLTKELHAIATEPGLWTDLPQRLELAALELGGVAPDDADAVVKWDWRRHGVVLWTGIRLLAPAATSPDAASRAALHRLAREAGRALGRLDACTVPLEAARQGRLGLPLDALETQGIPVAELPEALGAEGHGTALDAVLAEQLAQGQEALEIALREWAGLSAPLRGELRAIAVRLALAQAGFNRLRGNRSLRTPSELLPPWRSLWTAWHAARTAHR